MRRARNLSVLLILSTLAILLAALVFVLAGNRDRFGPWLRALSLPTALLLALVLLIVLPLAVAGLLKQVRRLRQEEEPVSAPVAIADDLARAAGVQAQRAGEFIDRVSDPQRKAELARELSQLQTERQHEVSTLHVVVFGTVSAGKTSLINALIGREVGKTEAVMGTTRHGESHTYELKSVDAVVSLTDTPGMSEAGEGGEAREIEARALAVRADLLLFVVDHDLIRSEYAPLIELARLGKRSIVVLNKKDRFPDDDLAAILAKLRERLSGVIDPADIVAVAAAPRPMPVRVQRPDGSFDTVLELERPGHRGPPVADRRGPAPRGQAACMRPTCWSGAGSSSRRPRSSSPGSGTARRSRGRRTSPVDHRRHGLRQPDSRARHPGRGCGAARHDRRAGPGARRGAERPARSAAWRRRWSRRCSSSGSSRRRRR